MTRQEIIESLEKAIAEAKELGADTRYLEAVLSRIRESWDGLDEYLAEQR